MALNGFLMFVVVAPDDHLARLKRENDPWLGYLTVSIVLYLTTAAAA